MKEFLCMPEKKTVDGLIEKLYDHISAMECLQDELAEAIECYADDSDSIMAEMELYLDDAVKCREINNMLYLELNAGRKELLRLIECLRENDIEPPGERYIHYDRLDPDVYEQDPAGPLLYLNDSDEHFQDLLETQYMALLEFEEKTPMTTTERNALRNHVIGKTGLDETGCEEWMAFLSGFRARFSISKAAKTGSL